MQPVRTAHELVCATLWSGLGWGSGQVTGQYYGDKIGRAVGESSGPAGGSGSGSAGGDLQLEGRGSPSGEDGSGADKTLSQQQGGSRSAVDPISLMVQV